MGEALTEHPFVVARTEHRKLNPDWVLPANREYGGISRSSTPPYLEWASGAVFGLQRSMYMALGPLSTEFAISHDMEYCWRAQSAGYSLHLEPRAVVHYREKTRLKARFMQGRNWGHDGTRLELLHGRPVGSFAVLRQDLYLARMLPSGIGAALLAATGWVPAKRKLADWVWNFGWAIGMRRALANKASGMSRWVGPGGSGTQAG
jgi:hypothetical protein